MLGCASIVPEFPSSAEEGWLRGQLRRCGATLFRADGREAQARQRAASKVVLVNRRLFCLTNTTPAAPFKGCFATSY
jgi:hypothetical protein